MKTYNKILRIQIINGKIEYTKLLIGIKALHEEGLGKIFPLSHKRLNKVTKATCNSTQPL